MKIVGNILWIFISLAATITLAVTLIIPYLPPHSPLNIISSMNLVFPYALIFSVICAAVCLYRKQFYTFLWVFIILLLSIPNINKSIGWNPHPTKTSPQSLKVVSYNVHFFNFYDHKQANALSYLKSCDADILCLQEVLALQKDKHTWQQLCRELSQYRYKHVEFLYDGPRLRKGLATFSKYPIVKKERAKIDAQFHGAISSWIKVGSDTLQVINCYLESNRLTSAEKEVYKSQEKTNLVKRIYYKLASASQKRGKQAEVVAQMKDAKHPTLVCGDLNDVPTSYVYRTILADDTDTFMHLRRGIGNTFHEGIYRFRIDYIFADDQIEPLSFCINKQPYSDHYPIELQYKIK